MKTKLTYSLLSLTAFASLFILAIISCKKERQFVYNKPNAKQLEKLENWYQLNLNPSEGNQFSTIKPTWEQVYVKELNSLLVYEVILSNSNKLMIISNFGERASLDKEVSKHGLKLLIFESKATGKILYGAYMSIESKIPEASDDVHYMDVGNFNGSILFYHFNGMLSNGWLYADGKPTNQLKNVTQQEYEDKKKTQSHSGTKIEGYNCYSGYAERYQMQCVTVGGLINCNWAFQGYDYITNCLYYDDEEPRRNLPGEGGGGSYFPPVYVDCAEVPNGSAYFNSDCNTCMGGTTGITECPPKEIKDSLLNKCMKNVMNIIITQNGSVNGLLRSFTDNSAFSPNYNWILKNKTLPEANLATTGNWDRLNRNVTTEIDDSKFSNASDLAIAKTLLHEGIHAYLVAYFANDPSNANKEYSELFNNYMSAKRPDLNEIHHNEMARLFVAEIGNSLKQFGDTKNYTFSSPLEKDRFYSDLAWGGLFESKAFKALSAEEQNRIKDVVTIEQKGEDPAGSPKTQKGKTGGCL